MSIRRLAVLCTAMLCAGMLVLCRVFWIAADQSYAASAAAQTVSETVLPIRRGNFYDRIGRPLTGVTPRWYALCIPGDSSYATLFPFVPFAQQAQLYARRNSITPFLIEVEDDLSANGVFMVADARRYLPTPIARHLIGYLDGDGHGMTGWKRPMMTFWLRRGTPRPCFAPLLPAGICWRAPRRRCKPPPAVPTQPLPSRWMLTSSVPAKRLPPKI